MVNQMYLDKANVLIEALPYIQRFNRKIIVIKYGGSAMVDEELKRNVIQDVVLLKLVGFKPIIVHGGGKEISRWVGKVGMEPKFVNGLRVTDADTMEVAEMVLNKVNKELVTMIQSLGVNAVGISGKDGGLLNVEKKLSKGEDIGFVGNIKNVNPKVLYDLLENDFLPVVCPVGMDDDFNTYNINADDAACAIAEALNAEKLAFLTDIEGVYKDPKDPESLISELHVQEARDLITNGNVGGGMIPTYIVLNSLKLTNNFLGYILPALYSGFDIIIMRTFIKSIPGEIRESAMIDGAGDARIFFSFILPLSKATIATIALFTAVGYWNDYFSTVLYIRSVDKWALQAVLRNMLTNTQQAMQQAGVNVMAQTNTNAQTIKAGTIVVSTVPILIVYPFVQKYFVKGVMIGGVKG